MAEYYVVEVNGPDIKIKDGPFNSYIEAVPNRGDSDVIINKCNDDDEKPKYPFETDQYPEEG